MQQVGRPCVVGGAAAQCGSASDGALPCSKDQIPRLPAFLTCPECCLNCTVTVAPTRAPPSGSPGPDVPTVLLTTTTTTTTTVVVSTPASPGIPIAVVVALALCALFLLLVLIGVWVYRRFNHLEAKPCPASTVESTGLVSQTSVSSPPPASAQSNVYAFPVASVLSQEEPAEAHGPPAQGPVPGPTFPSKDRPASVGGLDFDTDSQDQKSTQL